MRLTALSFLVLGALGAGCAPQGPSCSPACGSTQACCELGGANHCTDILVDRNHCGACGNACAASQMCSLGHCVAASDSGMPPDGGRDASGDGCPSGQMRCGTTCISSIGIRSGDGRTDPSFTNCAVCGIACDAMTASRCGLMNGVTTGTPTCLCGNEACTGSEVCEMTAASTFACVDHQTDPMHCGTADGGVACATGEACVDGVCTCNGADGGVGGRCPAGQRCTATGCLDTMTDPMNCGMVGTVCRTGESCIGGMCGCGTAGMHCPGPTLAGGCGQICCNDACVYTDDYNCGGCGVACAAPMMCVHNVPFGVMNIRCGDGTGMQEACDAPTDAAPSDAGGMSLIDADVDADVDAGIDAGDDASVDAFVDPG